MRKRVINCVDKCNENLKNKKISKMAEERHRERERKKEKERERKREKEREGTKEEESERNGRNIDTRYKSKTDLRKGKKNINK